MNKVRGYKVFNPDWTCRGFKYDVGKIYEEDVAPKCCYKGFHFCLNLIDCFIYYGFDSDNKVAEIIAHGDVDYDKKATKCCTNKIEIVRELDWLEVLNLVNCGKYCTGLGNTGDYNAGCYNTIEPKILLFNKPSEWTYNDWEHSRARDILEGLSNMNMKEKEDRQKWWNDLSNEDKAIVKSIPNFNANIFKEIIGITV